MDGRVNSRNGAKDLSYISFIGNDFHLHFIQICGQTRSS